MSYSNKIEMFITQNNIHYFELYEGKGFNFIYPTYNEELQQIWNKVQGIYYFSDSEPSLEYILYSSRVFKTIPNNDIIFEHISPSYLIGDKIVFDSEEEALYFKLKYC